MSIADDQREWLSFEDPTEQRTWLFDLSFLGSKWSCIYGRGCPGIEPEPNPDAALGCCIHGAYLSDDDDRQHVEAMTAELTSDTWQLKAHAEADGGPLWQDDEGWWRTKVVDGVCIFQNRPDHTGGPSHPGGPGCAFHHLADATDRHHVETKPEICWQAPLRREDHETVTGHIYSMVREWEQRDWGGDDQDVSWWCTEAAQAHIGDRAVYQEMGREIEAICGADVYQALVSELERRRAASDVQEASQVLLPHPAVRRR